MVAELLECKDYQGRNATGIHEPYLQAGGFVVFNVGRNLLFDPCAFFGLHAKTEAPTAIEWLPVALAWLNLAMNLAVFAVRLKLLIGDAPRWFL